MPVTINSYIESLLNTSERFRTLRDVRPATDAAGQPVFSSGDGYARFAVVKGGADYAMICFLRDDENPSIAQEDRIMNVANKRNRHIAPCEYRRNELTVFDHCSNAVRRDVLLCARPDGLPLGQYVRSHLFSSDRKPFRSLLKGFAAMARSLNGDDIAHGNLKPENIIVAPDGTPVAIDFAMAHEPSERSDRLALAVSALVIYLTGCEPDIYPLMGGKIVFGVGGGNIAGSFVGARTNGANGEHNAKTDEYGTAHGIAPYLRQIKAQLEFSGIEAALDVVAIIENLISGGAQGDKHTSARTEKAGRPAEAAHAGVTRELTCAEVTRAEVDAALERLSMTPFTELSLLADILRTLSEPDYVPAHVGDKTLRRSSGPTAEDPTLLLDFADCDYVGNISDTLIRFRKDNRWGYCDRYGRLLGKAEYLSAEDFYEARAKVETVDGYGLIDRGGAWIMRPEFDQLEWHGPENVASACRDGVWGIYSRMGDSLTSERYDWLGGPDEGFFVAAKGGKYCYLKLNGEPLTDFRFDEAFSFCGGRALVMVSGESFHIDREGRKIT